MSIMNKRDTYGSVTIALHWLLFLLILGLMASGKYSDSLSRNEKIGFLIDIHKQVGVAVFLLMAFRLLWKLINQNVTSLHEMSLIRLLTFFVHWGLYLVVLGQALTGIAMLQYAGRDVFFFTMELPLFFGEFGVIQLPEGWLPESSKAIPKFFRTLHHYGGNIIIVLVGLHFIGAIFNHLIGGETLKRMWFGYLPPYADKD